MSSVHPRSSIKVLGILESPVEWWAVGPTGAYGAVHWVSFRIYVTPRKLPLASSTVLQQRTCACVVRCHWMLNISLTLAERISEPRAQSDDRISRTRRQHLLGPPPSAPSRFCIDAPRNFPLHSLIPPSLRQVAVISGQKGQRLNRADRRFILNRWMTPVLLLRLNIALNCKACVI